MTRIEIRRPIPADLDNIATNLFKKPWLKNQIAHLVSGDEVFHYHCLFADGIAVGVVGLLPARNRHECNIETATTKDTPTICNAVELFQLVVAEDHQRKGYGSLLVEVKIEFARKIGYGFLETQINTEQTNAIWLPKFYKQFGFKQCDLSLMSNNFMLLEMALK